MSWMRLIADTQVGNNPLVSQSAQHVVLLLKALDCLYQNEARQQYQEPYRFNRDIPLIYTKIGQ